MEKVYSSQELERVKYCPQPDGTAIAFLRENIERDVADAPDGEGSPFWTADEVAVSTSLPESAIEAHFDELWAAGENAAKTQAQRLDEMDERISAVIDAILGEVE